MHRPQLSALLLPLLLAVEPSSALLDCKKVRAGGVNFDLGKLSGPHSVVTSRWEPSPPLHHNTTYTLDICQPLKKSGKSKKGEECPNGTRVCAIDRLLKEDGTDLIDDVKAIAGSLESVGGSVFDYDAVRLKTSDSTADAKKEGVRIVMKGGRHPLGRPSKDRTEQKAIIEFLCDENKTGNEGEWDSEDKYEKASKLRVREEDKDKEGEKDGEKDGDKDGDKDDDKDGDKDSDDEESTKEHQLKNEGAALIWESYETESDVDVLRLTWYTKYACEKRDGGSNDDNDGDSTTTHWGFFTWFVIIVFLGIATYLIFGSWLNYNRYGARGWDLLPHGDTIRDIPYLMKDWLRRVLNTVQGTGSRGGYSAV
ncbi:Fc.00g008150.m01.CDS01 [Cosmosporella sp. VM-42]